MSLGERNNVDMEVDRMTAVAEATAVFSDLRRLTSMATTQIERTNSTNIDYGLRSLVSILLRLEEKHLELATLFKTINQR